MSDPDALRLGSAAADAATRGELGWDTLARAASAARVDRGHEPEVLRELLVFQLDDSPYAIPVERVREIVRVRRMTPVPHLPAAIPGVIALRGEVLQVVDLRMRLSLRVAEPTRRSRIIVLHGEDDSVTGVLVDAVQEVARVSEDQVRPAGGGDRESGSELFLRGEEFVSILDLDRVLEFRADD